MIKNKIIILYLSALVIVGVFALWQTVLASNTNGTIDGSDKYGWGENIGWLDFGAAEGNVIVTDSALTGYAFSENIGWISLNCSNGANTCATVDYKVANNGQGALSGYAWSENAGWINFNPSGGGVSINSSGEFLGYAWGENIGWVVFNCITTSSCSAVNYKVKTDWRPRSARPACNNSSDDDGDGKTDYPADPGCSSLTDTDETDPVVSGGLPASAYSPPTAPPATEETLAGFSIIIQNGAEITNSREVILHLNGGLDAKKMAISNFSNFPDASQEDYTTTKIWTLTESEGTKTVYVKFYSQYGVASAGVSDSIIYKLEETPAEKPTAVSPLAKDESAPPAAPVAAAKKPVMTGPSAGPKAPLIEKVPEILKSLVPEFLKPKPLEITPPQIPLEQIVPRQAPPALSGLWDLSPTKAIEKFVLAPLPKELKILTEKFSAVENIFNKIGVNKLTDIKKLENIKIELPSLAQASGLIQAAIPLAQMSPADKEKIPSEIVFASAGKTAIDLNIGLSIALTGQAQQKITATAGKILNLTIKPESPVKGLRGYLVFKSKKPAAELMQLPLASLFNSFIFALPVFAQDQYEEVAVEEKLVLLEFEYTDPDGDGIYTAEIQAPVSEGEYEIITILDYVDPELGKKAIRLTTVVDPEGYVFEKIGEKEMRLPGAVVSIFWLDPAIKKYRLWPAKDWQQENPQITDVTGRYSFLAPPGDYYLEVEAPGYLNYQSKVFAVAEGGGVHQNIELKTKNWYLKIIDWKTAFLILFGLLLAYNFYRDKIREKFKKS